ncbi:MAG: SBBP repeat-containing protein [Ignavibacteria bacterium]
MKILSFILFIIHYSLIIVKGQVSQEWLSRFALSASDIAVSIAVDQSGNVYSAGYSFTSGQNYDYAVVKYNSSGVQLWFAKYDGPGHDVDFCRSSAVDAQGNVYITGSSRSGGIGTEDYATLKYNSSGVLQWAARYNGPAGGADVGFSLVNDDLGNVYVTGFSVGIGSDFDFLTVKYNSAGDTVWTARFNGPGNSTDQAFSIVRDNSGNIYITGSSRFGSSSGTENFAVIKYNSSGVQQWVAGYNGPGGSYDVPDEVFVDASGNVYVTGQSVSSGINYDYATVKYNSAGVFLWAALYEGPAAGNEDANSITVDNAGNVYITGNSLGIASSGDYATIKYNSAGVQQWVARYNGTGNAFDNAHVVKIDALGNVYASGGSNGTGSNFDYVLIKYNSSGDTLQVIRYNGPANGYDVSFAMTLDSANNIYITGQSLGSGTGDDFATIKYSQTTGIQPISNDIPLEFRLYQNYPNPFNPKTKIRFDIPNFDIRNSKFVIVKLAVYDVLGREVAVLVNKQLKPGTYEVQWDGTIYPSGVYLFKLITGDFIDTKKMVLVK